MVALRSGLIALVLLALAGRAEALDKLRVEKAGNSIAFATLDVGEAAGIWRAQGIEIESLSAAGVRAQQLLASGDADINLGAGTSMVFRLRGVPAITVAALTGPPATFALDVKKGGAIHALADLKGRPIGVTTAGALTDWLVKELGRRQGWGEVPTIALGTVQAELAALKTGQIDAFVTSLMTSYEIEGRGDIAILTSFDGIVRDFHANVIMATDKLVADETLLRRFLVGWFRSVAYVKSHRAQAIAVIAKVMQFSASSVDRAFDAEMAILSDDGSFSPAAVAAIARSLKELGLADSEPDPKLLYTDKFVPVKF